MSVVTEASGFISRLERFDVVGSTNDVVRAWLAGGTPEVCVAVSDLQTAGRGRAGRSWSAGAGQALLVSAGFRPSWLRPDEVWRLAAVVSLAMADAAEVGAGLPAMTIRLKWPNDLVVADLGGLRKLGGVLGETDGLGGPEPTAVVGIGVNADWPGSDFPTDLAASMTSLREAAGGRPIDRDALLDGFLGRLEARTEALRRGRFDVAAWVGRQATTGREILLSDPEGGIEHVRAVGVDASTGALVVADAAAPAGERAVLSAEVVSVRIAAAGL